MVQFWQIGFHKTPSASYRLRSAISDKRSDTDRVEKNANSQERCRLLMASV